LGLAEAAKACGVSVSTLRRKRQELTANGAAQTANGWRIPVTALIALGLMDRTTDAHHESRHDTPAIPAMTPTMTGASNALAGELNALRAQLADAEQRAAVAEAVAAERERIIEAQAMALRMLEASKNPVPKAPTPPRNDDHEQASAQGYADYPRRPQPAPLRLWKRLSGARR
jgi:hypothetical protein